MLFNNIQSSSKILVINIRIKNIIGICKKCLVSLFYTNIFGFIYLIFKGDFRKRFLNVVFYFGLKEKKV